MNIPSVIATVVIPIDVTTAEIRTDETTLQESHPISSCSRLLPRAACWPCSGDNSCDLRTGVRKHQRATTSAMKDALASPQGDQRADSQQDSSGATSTTVSSSSDSAQASASVPAAAPATQSKASPGFFTRWGKAYLADWTNTTATDPNAPQRRGTPAPISSPPFPGADYPIGPRRKSELLIIRRTCCKPLSMVEIRRS